MNSYEHTLIIRQDISESQSKNLIDKYKNIINENLGKVIKLEEWGLKTLSHSIKNNKKGYYLHIKFEGSGKTIQELEKAENIDETDISSFEISTCGFNNIVVFLGGRFGSWLEERGPETMRAYAIEKIGEVLGQKATNYVDRTVTTAWSNDFLTGGSYSYAKPFGKRYRKELAKSINRTLYFAGEATVESHYGSAHGAHLSGLLASKEIIKDIKTNKL